MGTQIRERRNRRQSVQRGGDSNQAAIGQPRRHTKAARNLNSAERQWTHDSLPDIVGRPHYRPEACRACRYIGYVGICIVQDAQCNFITEVVVLSPNTVMV